MPARTAPPPQGGRILLAATPIGNARDASLRLADALRGADVIAAEDTRRIRRLLADLGIETKARILSCFEGNEEARSEELVAAAQSGELVVLVTDAGMPLVSDPGYRTVQRAMQAGVQMQIAPGPSAALAALALSGLPVDRFCFEGFLPRRAGERRARLAELASEPRTMVFFEAPHRTAAMVGDAAEAFGIDRPAALCRELTKTYEEVVRGTLADLVERTEEEVLGEVTIVIAGATSGCAVPSAIELVERVRALEAEGVDRKEATARVARETGLPRRKVFDALVAAKQDRESKGSRP